MRGKVIPIPKTDSQPTVAQVDERLQALAEDVQHIRAAQTQLEIDIAARWATGNTADLETEFAKLAVRLLAAARVEAGLLVDRQQAERLQIIKEISMVQSEYALRHAEITELQPRLDQLKNELVSTQTKMDALKQAGTDNYQLIKEHYVGFMKSSSLFTMAEAHGLRLNPMYKIPATRLPDLLDAEAEAAKTEAG